MPELQDAWEAMPEVQNREARHYMAAHPEAILWTIKRENGVTTEMWSDAVLREGWGG